MSSVTASLSTSSFLPFSLQPAIPNDIPNLAHIAGEAFLSDRHTQMKALGADPYNHEQTMTEALSTWIQRPPDRCHLIKAVDDTTQEILGWVCWGFRGFQAQPPAPEASSSDPKGAKADKGSEPAPTASVDEPPPLEETDLIKRLEALTDADMQHWMSQLMPPGTKCMFIISIVVAPAYQGRGVGSALIRYGTKRADDDGVYCWVHASEAGYHPFAKQGFKVVGQLRIDLDEYAPVPPPEGGKWGEYIFRYMKRVAGAGTG